MLKLGRGYPGQCNHPHHNQYQISPAFTQSYIRACIHFRLSTEGTRRLCSISTMTSPCISDLLASESFVLHARHLVRKSFSGTFSWRYVPENWTVVLKDIPPLLNPI